MPEILKVANNHKKIVDENLINDCINEAYALNLPPSYKGKRLKIYGGKTGRRERPAAKHASV